MKKSILEILIHNYEIKKKFAIIFFFIIFLSFIFIGFVYYKLYKNSLLNDIDEKLLSAAQSINLVLDDNYFDKAVTKNTITAKEDEENIKKLSKLAKIMKVTYIYTCLLYTSPSPRD
jgi:hypothetical protein